VKGAQKTCQPLTPPISFLYSLGFAGRPGPSLSLKIGSVYIECRHRLAYFWRSMPRKDISGGDPGITTGILQGYLAHKKPPPRRTLQ